MYCKLEKNELASTITDCYDFAFLFLEINQKNNIILNEGHVIGTLILNDILRKKNNKFFI
jgi:hypothetical protein